MERIISKRHIGLREGDGANKLTTSPIRNLLRGDLYCSCDFSAGLELFQKKLLFKSKR